jgi:hypothetical protein
MKLRAILAPVLALAGLALAFPTAAGADPVYPPTTCATLSLSTTHPAPGASITVVGASFDPDARIRLRIVSPKIYLGTVHSNGSGGFTTTVKMPAGLTGARFITAEGGQVNVCPVDPQQIYIQGSAAASGNAGGGGANSGGSNGGGIAFTGEDIAGLLAVALALIGLGVLLNRRSRAGKRVHTDV